ncbi:MAG: hypothetical protein E6I82_05660 [Chloroflexi bacterium]|nr:MAG: hypothetical protein E6I82_05660 [Chloroflexota bacterium]
MVRACAVCGLPIPEGARFCPNCGAAAGPLVETEERKMVTVLFADLVDSTGLAQRLDAERSRELLGRFFDAASDELTALRGRPEKFIGDAVMAVFGLPHVHEDDALRAVRAGLAIRERVGRLSDELGLDRPLQVRIGIETGEAAVGRSPTGQLLVTGPVVNAAARLQAAGPAPAGPGQGFRRQSRGVPGGTDHRPLGPAHNPVRRPGQRAGDPGSEPWACQHDRTARPGDDHGRGRHRQVAPGGRACGGRQRSGPDPARAVALADRHGDVLPRWPAGRPTPARPRAPSSV